MKQMTKTSGKTEWYTPTKYVEAARVVLGGIDLDPATCAQAQETVRAAEFYTIEDEGLLQEWRGRVFMNPPYGHKIIDAFIAKLLAHHAAGEVPEYICLTNDCLDTQWAHNLLRASCAVCFVRGRVKFNTPGGNSNAPPRGQMFCYAGDSLPKFEEAFGEFGLVLCL